MRRLLFCLCVCLAFSGCAEPPARTDAWCELGPIRPTQADADAMSEQLVNQLLVLDRFGAARCGWRP